MHNKIILFDWGGIVENHIDSENGWFVTTEKLIKRLSNGKHDKLDVWSRFEVDGRQVHICTVNKDYELDKWIESVSRLYDFNVTKEEFLKAYEEEYDNVVYYKDVVNYIHSLKNRCRIGVLSNLIILDKKRLDKQVDLSKFDKVFLSFELGLIKPNKDIYEKVTELLGIDGKDILFFDDRLDNVEGARSCGWQAYQASGERLEDIKEKVEEFLSN